MIFTNRCLPNYEEQGYDQKPLVKPVPADLSQLQACSQYSHLQKVHSNHMEISLFPLNHHLLISMEIKKRQLSQTQV